MNKKVLWIALILLVVLGVAAVLYPKLSANMLPQQMAITPPATNEATEPAAPQPPTEAATEPPETTAATEPAEPKKFTAPNFTCVDWDGNPVQLTDYVGKPIVLNFWTYWCDYCLWEMPEFNAVYEELGGEVTFLMVHADTNTEKGKQALADAGYTFTVVFDEEEVAKITYGAYSYPLTFFIDAQGDIQTYGFGMIGEERLRQGIDLIYTAQENVES